MTTTNKYGLKLWEKKNKVEAGLDECARGCMIGRTYSACVIWSPEFLEESIDDPEFSWIHKIRDSKKMSSSVREKIAEYIKEFALDYQIVWTDEKTIDKKNILNAVQDSFHTCIRQLQITPDVLYVDGNVFRTFYDEQYDIIQHKCIEQGDNKYLCIASASILAKVEHDKYIQELCDKYPILSERYDLSNNMGYGTAKHLDGIRKYGITQFHRTTFGPCKEAVVHEI